MFVCFSVDDNFDQYDAGLVTFIKAGPGEEWRLVQVEEEEMDTWTPESGWQVRFLIMLQMAFTSKHSSNPGQVDNVVKESTFLGHKSCTGNRCF